MYTDAQLEILDKHLLGLALDGPLNGRLVSFAEAAHAGYAPVEWPTGEFVWEHKDGAPLTATKAQIDLSLAGGDGMSAVLVYNSNNSGGNWWLDDGNWKALEAKGWTVHWYRKAVDKSVGLPDSTSSYDDDVLADTPGDGTRWLGALATSCAKRVESPQEGIAEWELITGEHATAQGCNCCGPPHSFTYRTDDGERHYIEIDFPTEGTLVF